MEVRMAQKKVYDKELKVQAVKLGREIWYVWRYLCYKKRVAGNHASEHSWDCTLWICKRSYRNSVCYRPLGYRRNRRERRIHCNWRIKKELPDFLGNQIALFLWIMKFCCQIVATRGIKTQKVQCLRAFFDLWNYSHSANSSIGLLIYNGFTSKTFANMLMICTDICGCFIF